MPRVPLPCFKKKQLPRHIRVALKAVPPATLANMPYVRTYTPQVGYLLSYFDMLHDVRKRKHSTAQHSSTANTLKMTPKKSGEKTSPRPLSCNIFLPDTPCTTGQKNMKIEQQSFSLSRAGRPPLSRPPRPRFGPGSIARHSFHVTRSHAWDASNR